MPAVQPVPDHLRSAIESRLRSRQIHGLAVCGFALDGVRFASGHGCASIERSEAVTPATVFRVASISKLLTTTLALGLVDAGDLDLAAPVNHYLAPDLQIRDQAGAPAVSPLRSLLSHTSGIPFGVRGADLGNPVLSYVVNGGRVRTLEDAIRGLRVARGPGERIVYSNSALNVVGHVAAQRHGTSFEAAAQEHVLGPLGMADSAFASDRRGPGVATPYGSIAPPAVSSKPADVMRLVATPMGGLTTTVLDLARFGRMVLGGGSLDGQRILSPDLVATATSLEATNHPGLDQGYGLGFKVRSWRGRTLVGHDGNMPGVSTQLWLSPADGVGAVVLTNGYALGVPHEVALLALEHLLGLDPEVDPGPAVPPDPTKVGEWEALAARAKGTFRLADSAPPGLVGKLADRMLRVTVARGLGGRLTITGNPGADGPMWLLPDGELGRYRVDAAVDDGTTAVVDEQADGVHIWIGHTTHLHRR